jgi:hypothetical protein
VSSLPLFAVPTVGERVWPSYPRSATCANQRAARAVGAAVRDGSALAHAFLGVQRASCGERDRRAAFVDETPTKAEHVALAIILGGIESSITRESWRRPSHTAAVCFQQLAKRGYGLSEVEQIVNGDRMPESDLAE